MGICTCTYNPQIIKDNETLNIKIEAAQSKEKKDKHLLLNNQIMINKTFQGATNINKQNLIDNSMINNDALIIHHCHSALIENEHSGNDSKKSLTSLTFNKRPILAKLLRKRSNQV